MNWQAVPKLKKNEKQIKIPQQSKTNDALEKCMCYGNGHLKIAYSL